MMGELDIETRKLKSMIGIYVDCRLQSELDWTKIVHWYFSYGIPHWKTREKGLVLKFSVW